MITLYITYNVVHTLSLFHIICKYTLVITLYITYNLVYTLDYFILYISYKVGS